MGTTLSFLELKQSSRCLLESRRKNAGWSAVIFFLLLYLSQFIFSTLFEQRIVLPKFATADELISYFSDGHTDTLLLLFVYEAVPVALSLLFGAVFSAYCLHLAQGQPAGSRSLLGCLRTLPRYLLLFVLFAAALFFVCVVYSLLALYAAPLAVPLTLALAVCSIVAFYGLRLCLFAVADRNDFHILSALKECWTITKGHKKELFFLDLSFLWYEILIGLILNLCAALPQAAANLASGIGSEALIAWLQTNTGILSPICSLLGIALILPLHYRFQTQIQLTYALAYQALKKCAFSHSDTQPLAYQEFDETI